MTYARKTLSEIKLIHGDFGNFIKGQKLDKRKEKKYKTPPYKDLAASNEIEGEPLDEKCWPGYEKKGMKTMFGKRYPNLSLIHISEPTRPLYISYAVFCLKKKN